MRIQFQSLLRSNFRCGRMLGHRDAICVLGGFPCTLMA